MNWRFRNAPRAGVVIGVFVFVCAHLLIASGVFVSFLDHWVPRVKTVQGGDFACAMRACGCETAHEYRTQCWCSGPESSLVSHVDGEQSETSFTVAVTYGAAFECQYPGADGRTAFETAHLAGPVPSFRMFPPFDSLRTGPLSSERLQAVAPEVPEPVPIRLSLRQSL